MTTTPTAFEQAQRMGDLAEDLWGDEYTLKLTLWNDGDFRVVAYHVDWERPEDDKHVEELWHQASENDPHQAAWGKVRLEDDQNWAPDRGEKIEGPVPKQLPRP